MRRLLLVVVVVLGGRVARADEPAPVPGEVALAGAADVTALCDELRAGEKDAARGWEGTFVWFVEEVGELARALHRGDDPRNLEEEFADVAAWLVSLASLRGVDMGEAARKYTDAR